jgi:hypothetical protein
MRTRKILLLIDSIVNFILGLLLILYSPKLAQFLGMPLIESAFYPNILGGEFIGIALAIFFEAYSKNLKFTSGLGILGAICINLCGSLVLLYWLLFGNLDLPLKGLIFLWSLDVILLVIISMELANHFTTKK